jgi:hypothetical protein
LEAHVNSVAEEFISRPEVSLYERSILLEKEIRLETGEFKLGGLKIYPITERFLFIYQKFSGEKLDRSAQGWSDLSDAIALRNRLTHPKEPPILTDISVKRAIQAVITAINALFEAIYRKPLPSANLDLQSRLVFLSLRCSV